MIQQEDRDIYESIKNRRVYTVYLKASADIKDHIRIKAVIGEHGGEDSIYINKSISTSGFTADHHKLLASICGTMGEMIKGMNFCGDLHYYYAIAATKEDINIENNCYTISEDEKNHPIYAPCLVDIYFVRASNRNELLNNNEFNQIYNNQDYRDSNGNFKGIAFGIGEFHNDDIVSVGLLDKVYHARVSMCKDTEFMLYTSTGVNHLPKPNLYSNEYRKAVIKVLNDDYLSQYVVQVNDTPK